MAVHLTRSECEVNAVYPMKMICCVKAEKRMGILGVTARNMMALTVQLEPVTLIGKGRWNLTCCVY
jgi:hypothetical protein